MRLCNTDIISAPSCYGTSRYLLRITVRPRHGNQNVSYARPQRNSGHSSRALRSPTERQVSAKGYSQKQTAFSRSDCAGGAWLPVRPHQNWKSLLFVCTLVLWLFHQSWNEMKRITRKRKRNLRNLLKDIARKAKALILKFTFKILVSFFLSFFLHVTSDTSIVTNTNMMA